MNQVGGITHKLMQIKRHFLGWDGPIVEKVSGWLLGGKKAESQVDFQDTLIVVPTLQAGRRLKEVLARHCHERQAVLLSAVIVTPHHFFSRCRPGTKAANPAVTKTAWTEILEKADLAKFSVFFPRPGRLDKIDKFRWALSTGEIIERLRQELADGGYGIPDVISKHGNDLQELERWNDLAGLEKLYLRKLEELGFSDACREKIRLADKPELEPGLARIVVACVPDPNLLAVRALQNLARDHSVDILIHAPESVSGKFDEWGRPVAGEWTGEDVEIPDWDKNVFLEASPDTQGRKVVEIISGLPAEYGPADIGIGVPDTATIPFLKNDLRAIGLPAFDPSDAPFNGHALGRLVGSVFNLLQSRAYLHVADLLRHPDFLRYLEEIHKLAPCSVLTQLDEFQNYYLPVTLENMLAPFDASVFAPSFAEGFGGHGKVSAVAKAKADKSPDKSEKGSPRGYEDFTLLRPRSATGDCAGGFAMLGKALGIIKGHVDAFENKPLEEAWRLFLRSVYEPRRISRDDPGDMEFQQAAEVIEGTFRELRELPEKKLGLDKSRLHAVFFRRLQEQTYARERADAILDLQGWLELPWTDTPVLIVAGLNEEFVPGGSLSDVFLPDSLRKILGLRDDLSRFGRDVYLLKALVESRCRDGRLCIIVGKYALSGDPLRPSRLLFRCPAGKLPARAGQLFKRIGPAGRIPAAETIFRLKPAAGAKDNNILEKKIIPVTAFRDYLACPFRFYLKRILKMETLDDDKNEMDALDFGQVIHEVLQTMGADKKLWAGRDAEKLGKDLGELAGEIMAGRYGKNLPLGALVALSSARARLEALAREQVRLAGAGWEIIATEQNKSIFRNEFTITGKIDRVDRHRESGVVRIIDYKTSDAPVTPQAAHLARRREETPDYNQLVVTGKADKRGAARDKELAWVDLQLPLYRLLYDDRDAFDPGIELAYFNLPKAVSETGLSAWDEFNNVFMASAMNCARDVLENIARGVFWPPAGNVKYDEDFKMLFTEAPDKFFDLEGFSS